jgi:hypothetical protein
LSATNTPSSSAIHCNARGFTMGSSSHGDEGDSYRAKAGAESSHVPDEAPMSRPPLAPFTAETAVRKVRLAEDAWNSRPGL